MKNLKIAAAVALLCAGAFADTFYVDPTGGTVSSDDYDGTAETWQGELVGPKKTLAAAAAEAAKVAKKTNPCTIIALPGEYKEGVSNPEAIGTAATLNRVRLNSNITLQSRDGKEKTFIIGAKSDAPNATSTGCGTNAIRCVSCADKTSVYVRGFTITGGRTFTNEKGNQYAGGISSGIIVDCVVSNNACAYRGGGIDGGISVSCRYVNNKATTGSNANGGAFYNCFFGGEQAYQGTYYHCTFDGGSYPRQGSTYNSLILGTGSSSNGSAKFWDCFHIKNPTSDCAVTNCTIFANAAAIGVDAQGRPLSSASAIIDKGNMTYFAKMNAIAKELDYDGNVRLYNGIADVGCYEHNPCADFSQILSPDGVITVTNVTSYVTGCVDRVSIGANETLLGTLNLHNASTTMWSFFAEVKGTGTLKVYFADAVEPSQTVAATGEPVEVKYTADAATGLKLVYEGEDGAAEVSRFSNATRVSIAAEGAEGLAISGDFTAAGEYVVVPGETKTVTFDRANAGLTYVRGITVNGAFYNLYDYPNGVTFTVDGSDRATAVAVETVTAEPKELFVDRVNGSDLNCGLYTNLAFQSLAKAGKVATANWTILVQPGVYDNEVSNPESIGQDVTLNRVALAANVTLKALGSVGETVIEGAASTDAAADDLGNGIGATRCVKSASGVKIIGFTLRNGRTSKAAAQGGAVNGGGLVVGCLVTNNCCSARGGAWYDAKAWRCVFLQNKAGEPGDATYYGTSYHCYYDTHPYNTDTYGCTFAGMAYGRAGTHYNGLFIGYNTQYSNSPKFRHCHFSYTPAKGSSSTPDLDEACVITNAASLMIDASYRPVSGSVAIDAGDMAYYDGKVPSGYALDGLDILGGQRVYNGTVDVGCGEYDWRGGFAKTLAKRGVAVEVASAGVTTNAVAGVDLADGETLTVKCTLKTDGQVAFKVVPDGEGAAKVMLGETELMPVENVYAFDGAVGENVVTITYAGDGKATVSDFALPGPGMLLLFR